MIKICSVIAKNFVIFINNCCHVYRLRYIKLNSCRTFLFAELTSFQISAVCSILLDVRKTVKFIQPSTRISAIFFLPTAKRYLQLLLVFVVGKNNSISFSSVTGIEKYIIISVGVERNLVQQRSVSIVALSLIQRDTERQTNGINMTMIYVYQRCQIQIPYDCFCRLIFF